MAKSPVKIQGVSAAVGNANGSLVALPKIDVPFTAILKRAKMTDLSKDLMPRLGIQRFPIVSASVIASESTALGEQVWKSAGDVHDMVRMVGQWTTETSDDGTRVFAGANTTDYIEISFYGTGLNLITTRSSNRNVAWSIDGGGETTINNYDGTSSVLNSRKYTSNTVAPITSGQPLALHTVKVRNAGNSALQLAGFEILNESITLKTAAGSAYVAGSLQSIQTIDQQAYNSSFASGSLGTRGGRVSVYMQDGQIKKAVTPTDASQQNLTAANHVNEEVIRMYHWREFGHGRTDDFSSLTGTSADKAFTLDDGTTTLVGLQVDADSSATGAMRMPSVTTRHIVFTFVGTGLDIVEQDISATASVVTVEIDGVSAGTLTTPSTTKRIVKLVSGLPFGTHTCRLIMTSGAANFAMHQFITYGPKKPTIPTDAVELADYFVMANFSATGVAAGVNQICNGVLRKNCTREFVYRGAGTWALSADYDDVSGAWIASNSTANAIFDYTFVGTGAVINFLGTGGGASTITVRLNGTLNATGTNVTGMTNDGGGTYTIATGSTQYKRLAFTGLTFGKYTITVERTGGAANLAVGEIDVITPVYSPQYMDSPSIESDASIGSTSIGDVRPLPISVSEDLPNWGQAIGVTANPSTTSTALIPLTDMSVSVKTNGNPITIEWMLEWFQNTTGATAQAIAQLYLDGQPIGPSHSLYMSTSGFSMCSSNSLTVPVAPGMHLVQLYWRTTVGANAVLGSGTTRNMSVREI